MDYGMQYLNYISIKEDLNTVKGVVFDHVGETAGLD